MFAIVQHDQHLAVTRKADKRVHRGAARLIRQCEGSGHRDWHQVGVGDRRQVDIPHAVAKLGRYFGRRLYSQTCLASTSRAGQGDQSVVAENLSQILDLGTTAHKTRQLYRKAMCSNGFRCAQWWKLVAQIGMAQLHHPFRAENTAQFVTAEMGQPGVGRKRVEHQVHSRARQHGLAAVRQVAQPCGAVDRRTDVVALVTQLHLPGMHADAQPDRGQRCPLQLQGTRHRVAGTRERDHEAITLALFNRPHTVMGAR